MTIQSKTSNNAIPSWEYDALRAEILNRHSLSDCQSASATVTILALWAAGFTLTGFALNADSGLFQLMLFSLQGICMIIPTIYAYPVVIRSAENARQILVIGAYIRIFFEGEDSKLYCKGLNWETINNKTNVFIQKKRSRISRLYYKKYFILSLASTAFYIILGIVSCIMVWILPGMLRIGFLILEIVGLIICVLFCYKTYKGIDCLIEFSESKKQLVKSFIEYGIERNLFVNDCKEELIKKYSD